MSAAEFTRELKFSLFALVLACGAVALLLPLATSGSVKMLAGVVGGAGCIFAAYLSGNLRLFCIWGLMVTLPFDLSKRIGPVIEKMGGESAFRIEMSDPFLFALAAFILFDIFTKRRPGLRIPKVIYIWIVIALMGSITAIFGEWKLTAIHEVVRMVKVTILFLVICNELRTRERILHCVTALVVGMILQSIVGLIQYYTGERLGLDSLGESSATTIKQLANSSVRSETVFRISAFLVHPNIFGIFLASLLPFAVAAFFVRVGKINKMIFMLGALLGVPALIGTLSRSGWLSFAASFSLLLLLAFFHGGLRRRAMLTATAAIIALMLVLSVYSGRIINRIFSSHEGAMLGRAEYNNDAKRMIMEYPILGVGLNCYVYAVPPYTRYGPREALKIYQGWIPAVHNIYYLWLAETGVIGFILHMTILGSIIFIGIRNLRVGDVLLFAINAACLSCMLAFLVDGFFSFSLRINSICRLFWVVSGIVMAVHYIRLREYRQDYDRRMAFPPQASFNSGFVERFPPADERGFRGTLPVHT